MSFGQTALGMIAVSGFLTVAIQVSVPEPPSASLPPAIQVNEIIIRDDGSTFYDRNLLAYPIWLAWAAVIYEPDGTIHCQGGDLFNYKDPSTSFEDRGVDWLVGGDCADGLEAGMKYYFTWTPMGPDYRPVRYPPEGYGIVVDADQTAGEEE